ncbi:MAG: glycosyltransferase family 2 protein [Candidatus Vogelbacteria bacterium]|nr:glycosyltransferase family 2 protein [Candidatus Vogelbacteria bacterium]
MSIGRKTISVVVPTFNVGKILSRCLESAKWADEIIVVDMGSTDKTLLISRAYGAKIIKNIPVDGNFDKNRKLGMLRAKGDWILKLDSDEELTPKLQVEIKRILTRDYDEINGYNIPNRIFMFGSEVKHGFVKSGSHELRLFRNKKWSYAPFRFHQQIKVEGETGFLKNYYYHYNFNSIAQFIEKMNRYTSLDSAVLVKESRIYWFGIFLAPVRTFIKLYFIQFGFLDGRNGLVVSLMFALYNFVEKIKIWELQQKT